MRHKRDDSPEILHIKYHNDDKVELVTLNKVKDSTLVNSQVPIWNFLHDVGESYVYVRYTYYRLFLQKYIKYKLNIFL